MTYERNLLKKLHILFIIFIQLRINNNEVDYFFYSSIHFINLGFTTPDKLGKKYNSLYWLTVSF